MTSLNYYTQAGCQLCQEALPIVQEMCAKYGVSLEITDINSSDQLIRDFGLRIPVLADPSGLVLAEGRISPRSLRKALKRYRRTHK